MTAPSLTHMEKAREVYREHVGGMPTEFLAAIARALADEHDAALERAADEFDRKGYVRSAAELRMMKNGEGR